MNKFEKLIEYVINDEDSKAQDLFHEIVVEKSREIYENLMSEEDMAEDEVDDLIDDIETDEEGVAEAEDDMEMDVEMGDEEGELELDADEEEGEEDLEDRVVDLEDKLDELMAEFEALMAGEAEEPEHADMAMDMDSDMEEGMFESEEEVNDDEDAEELEEGVALKAAPAPVKSEEGSVNKKSTVAANAGAKGAEAKPQQNVGEESGRAAPTAKDLIGKVGNTPAQSTQKPSAAPKAKVKGEESGTNAKSTI
jgi:hypothetical protein